MLLEEAVQKRIAELLKAREMLELQMHGVNVAIGELRHVIGLNPDGTPREESEDGNKVPDMAA
jgi:hypothetical protein